MQISEEGINLIKSFEKFVSHPYDDGYGKITIGYGSTYYPDGDRVEISDPDITEQRAEEILLYFVSIVEDWINDNVSCLLNQNQFDAMCSFFYNVGTYGFIEKYPNTWSALKNGELDIFANDMLEFIHSDGVVSDGLKKRRQEEYNLFKQEN